MTSSRRCGVEQRLAGGHDAVAARAQAGDQLGLRRARSPRSCPSSSRWTGPTFDDDADVGLGDRARARRSGPAPRIAISSTSASVPGGRAEDRQRQPDLGVEVLRGWPRRAGAGASIAARMSFVEVLPVEPVIADDAGSRARAARRSRARCSAASGSSAASTRAGRRAARRVGVLGRDEHAPRARRPAPAARSARRRRARRRSPTKRSPGPGVARVDHRARRAGRRAARARDEPRRPRPAATLLRRPRRARSASRATATSSNGTLRPPANSWPCSWPLPAMTTTSPARGQRDGALDRRAAVDASTLGVRRAGARRGSRR